VVDVANRVSQQIPNTKININTEAVPDKRSYRVDFSLYESLAPNHLPQVDLNQSIDELAAGLKKMNFQDQNFRVSEMMRLKVLQNLQDKKLLDMNLYWTK
jgi:UDP-glucose 4-epimerase